MKTLHFIKLIKGFTPLISWGTVVCIILLIFPAMLFSQSGEKYSVNMNSLGPVDKFGSSNYAPVRIFTNSTLRALFTADGNFEAWYDSYFKKNVTVDSTITAWEIYAMYRLSVYGDVVVTGIMKSAKLILTDGNITSMTGTVVFGSNNLTTTGNVTAGSFNSPSFAGSSRAMLATDTAGNIIRKGYSGNPNDVLTGDGNWSNLSQSTGWQWVDTNLVSTAAQVVIANNLAVAGKITVGQMKVISNGSNKDTLHTEKELVIITDSKNISLDADTVKIPRLLDSKRMETDTLNSKKINASKVYVAGDITSTGTVYTGNLYVANDVMLPLFTGSRNLLLTDSTGKVSPLGISSTSNKVLLSNGTWGAVPIPQNYWQMQGDDIYTLTPGNIGLGMNNPVYKLDVAGTVRISEDLLVGGGIIISEKVNATRELKSASLRADSIFMDNTKAFYGESRFVDSVKIQSKLRVDGNIDVGGDLRSSGNIVFGGDKTIGFRPATNGFPDIIYFASGPIIEPQQSPCFNPNVIPLQHLGIFHSYGDNVDGNTNNMYVGFDGADGVIDIGRLNIFPATVEPKLLINKFCGKDVHICTGTNGGNIQLTGSLGKVGIGIVPDENSPKLDIAGDVRISSLTAPSGSTNLIQVGSDGILTPVSSTSIGIGLWQSTGSNIYNTNTENTGIGINTPQKKLHLYSSGSNNCETTFRIENSFTGTPDGCFNSSVWDITATGRGGGSLTIKTPSSNQPFLTITPEGKLGIFTENPDDLTERLNVNGYGKFYGTGGSGVTGSTTIGFNGAHGYLNSDKALLINYYSGEDVVVGGGGNDIPLHPLPQSGTFTSRYSTFLAANSGSVGIGTNAPDQNVKLHVKGNSNNQTLLFLQPVEFNSPDDYVQMNLADNNHYIRSTWSKGMTFYDVNQIIFDCPKLGIGTDPALAVNPDYSDYKLFVKGKILCEKVKIINNVPTADYVFDKSYNLMPLKELENFKDSCKHLPDIPSAEEMKKNGIDLVELNILLLKKIEEQVLYTIELNKKIDALNEIITYLRNKNEY